MGLAATAACSDGGTEGGVDATVDAAPESGGGHPADAASPDSPAVDTGPEASAEAAADLPPPAPGTITGTIVNDTAADLPWPEGLRLQVSVEGVAGATATAVLRNGQFEFTLADVPAGPQVLHVAETDNGADTLDLFQAATRTVAVEVAPAATTAAGFHLRWHWEPHQVDAGGAISSCDGLTQMAFASPTDGMLVFNEPSGDGGFAEPHASVMLTSDGGQTWTVGSKQVVAGFHKVSGGNWFGTVPLLRPDAQTALALPYLGPLVRSADRGSTWQAVGFAPPVWGPGDITWGGLARSGSTIYLGAHTGGVQGSSDRDSLSRSTDGGLTWQVVLDRCERNEGEAACAAPTVPLGFAGIDIGCGAPGHCVVVGSRAVLHTTDDFATYGSFSVLAPNFGCGYAVGAARIYWVSPTTVWVVAPSTGCGNAPAPVRRISTDGGKTFGDWEPSPVSPGGDLVFAGSTALALEARVVNRSTDGGQTWRSTGPAPSTRGTLSGLRMSVVDAEHAWVSSTAISGCSQQSYSFVARWRP
jgi:hypothetical protein